jgi:hypothetical protein
MCKLDEQLAAVATMSPAELRGEWQRAYGSAAPAISADLLAHGLAYRLQERALKTREVPLARILRRKALPEMKPGTQLIREWNGRTIVVEALDRGFVFEEQTYHSLTAIAREVTGARWSGPRFFGLTANG